jgi:hypothetical protein
MIRPTANGHAFEYADGTPLFWLADTWWPCMTKRYPWYEDDSIRRVGMPGAGFKDYVRYQGNVIINSPIHLDAMALTGDEWNQAANIIIDRYDWAPFGH